MKSLLLVLALGLTSLLIPVITVAQIPVKDQSGPTQTKELPFFFPAGIKTTTDPVEQRQEYQRYLVSTWACNQGNPNGMQNLMPEPGSVSVQTNVVSTSSVTENPAKMRIVLDHFVKMPDGRVRVTTLCNQYFITAEQEQVVEKYLTAHVIEAAGADNDFYATIMRLAITARAQKLGIDSASFEKSLDEPMLDNKTITYREFNRIPKPSKASDFVPRELHLGFNIPLGGILGVTWLNTGVIYLNPDSLVTDFLTGRPKVLQHEMVHNNINVEKFPMSEAFDVELMADMPIVLYQENQIDLPSHSYATDLREMFQIYFNDDFEQAEKQSVKIDLAGNTVIDEIKYRYFYAQHEQVKAEALAFFQTVSIPEFYSDIAWWGSVNDIRGDKNSVFRMTLAQHYNPTILGSSKESLDWAEAHRELILQTANKGFHDALGGSGDSMEGENDTHVPAYLIDLYEHMFTQQERTNIEAYYKAHPAELAKLKTMSPSELMELAKTFKLSSNSQAVR
jgi:hypothetical protein